MSELESHDRIKGGSDRSFGLVFAAVFAVIALWPLVHGTAPRYWALAVAVAFLAVALVRPVLLGLANRLWTRLGIWLGAVVAPIVMAALFLLVVTPTGMLARAMGKDLLRLKRDKAAKSYWIERDDKSDPMGSMRNQF